jgi:hypothetical protein
VPPSTVGVSAGEAYPRSFGAKVVTPWSGPKAILGPICGQLLPSGPGFKLPLLLVRASAARARRRRRTLHLTDERELIVLARHVRAVPAQSIEVLLFDLQFGVTTDASGVCATLTTASAHILVYDERVLQTLRARTDWIPIAIPDGGIPIDAITERLFDELVCFGLVAT